MLINNAGVITETAPTAAQLALIKAYIAPDPTTKKATNPVFVGFTDAQIVSDPGVGLNAPTPVTNSRSPYVPATAQLTTAQFQDVMGRLLDVIQTLPAANANRAGYLSRWQYLHSLYGAYPPLPTDRRIPAFANTMLANGDLTAFQAATALYPTDLTWAATVMAGPSWAYTNLAGATAEASDVASARNS